MSLNKQALDFKKPNFISKYELKEELGRGACGIVYKGFDPFVQREVAVKIAKTDTFLTPEKTQKSQRNFFTEAHAAGKLQHPHIVALFDAGVEKDLSYIVMEYIDGDDLLAYCRSTGKQLSISKVVDVIFKSAKALAYSHSQGVLHRDIKPSNIMMNSAGDTRIMDFSIAEITQNLSYTPDQVMGSPAYMSPEQVRKETLGAASDLYSLGAVMFQLLAGQAPFPSKDVQEVFRDILHTPAPCLDLINPKVPKPLADIVAKCLEKNAFDRYADCNELAAVLTKVFDQLRYTEAQVSRRVQQGALKNLSFFDGFTESQIDEVLHASTIISFTQDETMIKEGDIDNTFYIIAKGSAEVRKGGNKIEGLRTGDCFGEIGFLMETKRTASVVAVSDVLVLKVNATLMESVSEQCQLRYYKAFTETLIYRLSLTSARLSARV